MELWYSLVELLPFDWAQSGGAIYASLSMYPSRV